MTEIWMAPTRIVTAIYSPKPERPLNSTSL